MEVLSARNPTNREYGKAWQIAPSTSLQALAEHLGVLEAVAALITRYRQDRIIWKEWLTKRAHSVAEPLSPTDDYPWEETEVPPEEYALSYTWPSLLPDDVFRVRKTFGCVAAS